MVLVMSRKLDLDKLKEEYIGKTFGWLTVVDVFREVNKGHSLIYFKCQCKCGTIKNVRKEHVINNLTLSCGCYNKSPEKNAKYTDWCKNNPDKLLLRTQHYSDWCKNNPDKVKAKTNKRILYYKQNPAKLQMVQCKRKMTIKNNPSIEEQRAYKYSVWCKNNPDKVKVKTDKSRIKIISDRDYLTAYVDYIHPEDFMHIHTIKSNSLIRIKCRVCGDYEYHTINQTFQNKTLKRGNLPLCVKCRNSLNTSQYEDEITDFISTFYDGEIVRNTREIISPQELDIYIPEKKIAIEFNGDYWHSDEYKEKDYHYNKFLKCKENGVLLVSIFESEWNNKKEEIKEYLKDLFNNKENKLSFNEGYSLMNNNYPSPNINLNLSLIQEEYYMFNNNKVYTCGYTKLV